MKPLVWVALALIVQLLPNASAATATSQATRVSLVDGGIFVEDSVILTPDPSETRAWFFAPAAAYGLGVERVFSEGTRMTLVNLTRESTEGSLVLYRAEWSPRSGSPSGGNSFTLSITYKVPMNTVDLRTYYPSPGLQVWVATQPGMKSRVEALSMSEIRPGVLHGGQAPVAGNFTYKVSYEAGPMTVAGEDVSKYVWVLAGLVVGMLILWFAVRQGWVRGGPSKRFVKGGAMESRSMLDARRRTLLAALKELEHAHETKEIPDDAYAPLKEEYKAQAVRVMRNLEEKKEGS